MNSLYLNLLTEKLSIAAWQIENCIELLEEGSTIPFISRYRKEKTGGLDEVLVAEIKHYFNYFTDLDKRKNTITDSIEEQGKLTEALRKEIELCTESIKLEDIYLPYRPKRRTRASIAKERGLEPLATTILEMEVKDCLALAQEYIGEEVEDVAAALQGARDIIAELISENAVIRDSLRVQYSKFAKVVAKQQRGMEEQEQESSKYRNYFDFSGKISTIPSHRFLALMRGHKEGQLSIKLEVESHFSHSIIKREIFKDKERVSKSCREQIELAIEDSYKRLLHPSIENEIFKIAKEKAHRDAVKVFGENLTSLLLAAPVGQKRVLALDPGFRTGCKLVCLDAQGELIHNDTIYPHPPVNEKIQAIKKISTLVEAYKIEVIAIGDGTASRETENFIKLKDTLSSLRKTTSSSSINSNDIININIDVKEIANDYDVDQMINRVKKEITKAASNRNVNTISRRR